jgi:hypothetical protein
MKLTFNSETNGKPMGHSTRHAIQLDGDMRCGCGNLLARLVDGGVELKCRRCHRKVVLPLEKGPSTEG